MAESKHATADSVEWKWDNKDVKTKWEAFTKFGSASATEMTGKNFDKWLKDAGVLDAKTITTTMTGIAFSKVTGLVSVLLGDVLSLALTLTSG